MPYGDPIPLTHDEFGHKYPSLAGPTHAFGDLGLSESWPTDYWTIENDNDVPVVKPAFLIDQYTVMGTVDTTASPATLALALVLPYVVPLDNPLPDTGQEGILPFHGVYKALNADDAVSQARAEVEV